MRDLAGSGRGCDGWRQRYRPRHDRSLGARGRQGGHRRRRRAWPRGRRGVCACSRRRGDPRGEPRAAPTTRRAPRAGGPRDEGVTGPPSIATIPSRWVDTPTDLAEISHRLRAPGQVALDTEGDSLHHYPERLSLIQLAVPSSEAWLVDPLAVTDLSSLASVFAAPDVVTVVHSGDNDLVSSSVAASRSRRSSTRPSPHDFSASGPSASTCCCRPT